MDQFRWPPFVLACFAAVLVVAVELGSSWLADVPTQASFASGGAAPSSARDRLDVALGQAGMTPQQAAALRSADEEPPGLAIARMAVLDGLLLFTMGLIAAPFLWTARVHGRVQGVITLVFSILILLAALKLAFMAFAEFMVMTTLFLAAPFGTVAYLVRWGFFDLGAANAALGLLLFLKVVLIVCLVLAHQRFLKAKGLMFLIACSFLAHLVITILHAIVPLPLVSITDAVGAIVVLILAILWALFFLIGSIPAVLKAVV